MKEPVARATNKVHNLLALCVNCPFLFTKACAVCTIQRSAVALQRRRREKPCDDR